MGRLRQRQRPAGGADWTLWCVLSSRQGTKTPPGQGLDAHPPDSSWPPGPLPQMRPHIPRTSVTLSCLTVPCKLLGPHSRGGGVRRWHALPAAYKAQGGELGPRRLPSSWPCCSWGSCCCFWGSGGCCEPAPAPPPQPLDGPLGHAHSHSLETCTCCVCHSRTGH